MKQRKKKSPNAIATNQAISGKSAATPSHPHPIPRNRLWLFRFSTVLSPILLFLILEVVLRLFGFGHPTSFFLRKTLNGQPVWIQNDKFAERFLGREMARQPFPLTFAEAHARLGLELGRQGDNAGAVAQFSEAVRLKPEYLEARLNLGIALTKEQRTAEAQAQFQEVLRRNPTNAIVRKYVKSLD